MSPYRRSADIAGTSNTGQLDGLDAPTLDPSTDTYIWVKAVREWSELIVQGAASGVFCRPDQCSLTNSYVDNNSSLISE
jgi:hypothetical protein